jgi:hypothetical protein
MARRSGSLAKTGYRKVSRNIFGNAWRSDEEWAKDVRIVPAAFPLVILKASPAAAVFRQF